MKQAYIQKAMSPARLKVVEQAAQICQAYAAQGFTLTLRQLYYQFVSRDLMPNTVQSYKRLGDIVVDGRMTGLLDWNWIEDRMRSVEEPTHWRDPQEIMRAVAAQFRIEKWVDQPYRPVVLIEKDALAGVIEGVCARLDVPYMACRGYVSISAMRDMGQRLLRYMGKDQTPIILHLGDHDPSGIDMTRDIADRLSIFMGGCEVRRLALNMDQVDQYNPPPNPAKETDARFAGYMEIYGDESWELDALEPAVIVQLVEDAVMAVREEGIWEDAVDREEVDKKRLKLVTDRWDEIVSQLEDEE